MVQTHSILAMCLVACLTAAAAAIVSIDVGADAVDGLWQPSCSTVAGGVVLTNISPNVRALIEGCTIAVAAGADASQSAVTIPSLGEHSSVELRGCTITATYTTTSVGFFNVHGALAIRGSRFGSGSQVIVNGTSLATIDTGVDDYGCGIFFRASMSGRGGHDFQFVIVNGSNISAACAGECAAVFFRGVLSLEHNALFAVDSSTLTSTGRTGDAHGFRFRGSIVLERESAIRFNECNVSVTAHSAAIGVFLEKYIGFREQDEFAVTRSNISARASTASAFGVQLSSTLEFQAGARFSVTESDVTATTAAQNTQCGAVHLSQALIRSRASVLVSKSTLTAASEVGVPAGL